MADSKRKKILKVALHVFGVLLFVFATSCALLAAYGYQIDLLHRNIVKTSIIDLIGEYSDVSIYSNGEQVASNLPYQIKNIQPDSYKVDIKSEKFHDWKRTVKVVEDFVTIIDDIYLIPENLEPFTNSEKFDFVYDDVVFNGQIIVFVNNERGFLHKFNLGNSDMNEFKTITLLNKFSYEKLYSVGSRYLAFDDGEVINLLDLSSDRFIEILVPDEFTHFNLGYASSLQGIYKNNGALFSVDINEEGVFNEITLIAKRLQTQEVNVYSDSNFIFVKIDDDLYEYRDHLLTLIASDVISEPHVSPFGNEILYLSNQGEIYVYSFETLEDNLIGRFAKKIDYLAWLFDGKHIFILQDGNLLLCDLTMDNCPILVSGISPENIYIPQTKPLLVLITQEGIRQINLRFK